MTIHELISNLDPFLKVHNEKFCKAGFGILSYLFPSTSTSKQFTSNMGKKILSEIVSDTLTAKYINNSIGAVLIPDVPHVDQLTFISQFIVCCYEQIQEHFLEFLLIANHTIYRMLAKCLK